ncbi:MAG TPA: response regulator transcription factor [Flavisolibacter sp.]|nr:response regulator transcription factor [Flavisolibacter sp.]
MIRLTIIESNIEYLNAIKEYLNKEKDILLVHIGGELYNISKRLKDLQPNVIVIDIDPFIKDCAHEILAIKEVIPSAQVLVLTYSQQPDVILEIINAGASGCLLKSDDYQKIVDAIYSLTKGESPLNEKIARVVIDHCIRGGNGNVEHYNLTKREKEIMTLLMEGLSYKQISHTCNISLNTVFSHARKIYEKAHVHSRSELAAKINNGKIT